MISDNQYLHIAEGGTPVYVYDLELLDQTLNTVREAASVNPKFRVHYAMKANSEDRILKEVLEAGFGLDTVSGGEIEIGLKAGFIPRSIVFAGVGKTDEEIDLAIRAGIGNFNVESIPELLVISERATLLRKKARVAIRLNPEIDAHTHHYITTGLAENKFGINLSHLDEVVDLAVSLENIELIGLHFHIGSQITITEPFELLCSKINNILSHLTERGIRISTINVGGGLAIDYENPQDTPIPDFHSYFNTFNRCLETNDVAEVHFELGRSIVGQCGVLLSHVIYVKEGDTRNFVIIDAGMNNLMRPALYQARHAIRNISGDLRGKEGKDSTETSESSEIPVDIVGPICESADVFGTDYLISTPRRGDIIAIFSAGAYGQSMASTYNSRKAARTVFI